MLLVLALLGMLALAVAAPPLARRLGRNTGYPLAAGYLAVAALLASAAPRVWAGDTETASWEWLPSLGVSLSLRLDGVAGVFCLIVLGVGALVMAYCPGYLAEDEPHGTVYLLLTLFATSMLGLVLAADVVLLYVFWELTTVCSFFLISTAGAAAARPARQALLVTAAGGLALLAAVVLLTVAAGTTDLATILAEPDRVLDSGLAWPIGGLLVLAACTKSAQLPFHFWLPGAMVAMTPVSAYLHSATMVKAGIYLLLRFSPLFAEESAWSTALISIGLLTAVTGAFLALRENDLKGILAYSTVSQLGLLVAVIGVGTPEALAAAVLHTFAHALFKATLFMLAGIVDEETGTRDIRELSGMWRAMPVTAATTVLAALSLAGVIPMLGFVSKEYLFIGLLEAEGAPWAGPVALALGVTASVLTFAYAARIVHGGFGGSEQHSDVSEPPAAFLLPGAVAAGLGLVLGPAVSVLSPMIVSAASDVAPAGDPPEVYFWHGLSPELAMSALTIVLGLVLFGFRAPVDRALQRLRLPDAGRLFDRGHDGVIALGHVVGGPERTSSPAAHLSRPLVAVVALGGVGALVVGGLPSRADTDRPLDWVVAGLLAVVVPAAVLTGSTLAAVGLVGITGLLVATWFLLAGAPDVALTLMLVEVMTAVVAVLVLRGVPSRFVRSPRRAAVPAAALALGAGVAATLATLAFTGRRELSAVGEHFLDSTEEQTGGTNVVNTILVDYRGLDTLGEAVVLGTTALGTALVLGRSERRRTVTPGARGDAVLEVGGRVLVPGMFLLSAFLLWRGHDEPGGGFIAALVAGAAIALNQLTHGSGTFLGRLTRPDRLAGAGLVLVVAVGALPTVQGRAFLTPVELPLLHALGIGSTFLFDLGVYLLVLGLLAAAVTRLEQPDRTAADEPPGPPVTGPLVTSGVPEQAP
ncbi:MULTISPECIES: hydrogen gas-evolving membrane-bound hydrogenase subunit E [unclassified Modestobacter]|uniref:hydrogen gas-evolving membrane-bound hydrogenase subunit E n=1 Tax=unclassified Modestobacter TaxID=2643866 RepID=UPI0022AA2ACA|nr:MULTISPECIES: hydrogen gas-evolving membrane-bound hydrogenase subunit E [unclassified Modestobacter]MCZ2823864.1 proton-conducting transporter membrane subunit [Modestobacter sp. VKM Ac-2981]MCZ2852109.1 proton-conducting transporter membrane subunit [Modestobacter sp. VKM Ac-2982]